MFRKKRTFGVPFSPGFSASRNIGSPDVTLDTQTGYKRYEKSLVALVQENKELTLNQLVGVRLRPIIKTWDDEYKAFNDKSNDIVDLQKLQEAHGLALKSHKAYAQINRCTKHFPSLQLKKKQNKGFGVSIVYNCSQCKFVSEPSKLYDCDSSGACLTNVQAGIALSKTALKPTDAHFLFATLNVNGPSTATLQDQFNKANQASSTILDSALSKNRGIVRDYVAIEKGTTDPVPAVAVAFDGQYDKPLYHGYDGHSSSVSEPVLEAETGLNLLVSHAVISKLDGSYEMNKVNVCGVCVVSIIWNVLLSVFLCLVMSMSIQFSLGSISMAQSR